MDKCMRFVQESRITAPPSAVFAFHESPGAFERLTPPWAPVEIVEGGNSLHPGTRVVLRVRFGPFSVRWIAEHVEYDPPYLFADRQVSGPFARWYHRHEFQDDGQGGTWLRDAVEFEPPLGRLGRALAGLLIERKLRRLFAYRHEVTRAFFATQHVAPALDQGSGPPTAKPAAPNDFQGVE